MGIRRESNNEGTLGKFMKDADGNLIIPGQQSTPDSTGVPSDAGETPAEPQPGSDAQGDGDPRPMDDDRDTTSADPSSGSTEADKGYS